MMPRDELAAWFRLVETPGVGRESARKLLAEFGSPEATLAASHAALAKAVGGSVAGALAKVPEHLEQRLAALHAWLDDAGDEARVVVPLGDPRYPDNLLHCTDPPLLLYVRGRVELLRAESIAVVGSRNPTGQGLENARAFAAHLSHAGLTIVSGLALGVDGAAHAGGLEGRGSTVAVVGTGLDLVYPTRHRELTLLIAGQGAIVSEFAIGTPALPQNFPVRNRIIAGLARGTLVVEAALQSGSLITARLASECGRDVFAIPGSIHSPQSRGCHRLIKQGAKLVDQAADILEEYGTATPGPRPAAAPGSDDATANEDPLLTALGFDPMALDALVARTGQSPATLLARLLDLELDGRVVRQPGQLFQRIERG